MTERNETIYFVVTATQIRACVYAMGRLLMLKLDTFCHDLAWKIAEHSFTLYRICMNLRACDVSVSGLAWHRKPKQWSDDGTTTIYSPNVSQHYNGVINRVLAPRLSRSCSKIVLKRKHQDKLCIIHKSHRSHYALLLLHSTHKHNVRHMTSFMFSIDLFSLRKLATHTQPHSAHRPCENFVLCMK